MKTFIRKIKWAWQRVIRGYDDRIFWEFDSYFTQFIPAIQEFCIEELKSDSIKFNLTHKKIFETTLKLIEEVRKEEKKRDIRVGATDAESKFWEYFGKHIGYYWN